MIRRLTREDKAAVSRLCARAVSEDFIPLYFDSFIDEKVGFGFEENGVLAGMVFTSVALDGEAWLFGLRVDPDHRQKGIGRCLTQRALEVASASCRVARLGIFTENHDSIQLARSFGFSARANYVFRELKRPPPPAPETCLERVGREDLVEVHGRLTADPHLQANNLLLPRFYEWFRLTQESLGILLDDGSVWQADGELAIVARSETPDPEIEIGYLSNPCGLVLPALLDRFAGQGPIEASLPVDPALEQVLERFGFVVPSWGSGMTILERELSRSS